MKKLESIKQRVNCRNEINDFCVYRNSVSSSGAELFYLDLGSSLMQQEYNFMKINLLMGNWREQ